ncbi:hypothetical protein MLD38_007342 [Melastoma candidum]|uniref:Uncharacterized protein n=1 Tax=Melastoma candidum TaxID=119954 RepID=A0ACB9RQS7_9MYRT|nr:hypothetical protein MLD38_007342 [Melastoma candidum]
MLGTMTPPDSPSSSSAAALTVLSIECLKGSARADEWTGDTLQTGDIVEELWIGGSAPLRSPFKSGRSGVQKALHASYRRKETLVVVRVRRGGGGGGGRGDDYMELQACIVPYEGGGKKKEYMLRGIQDPNYAVGFCDRTESECLRLQAMRSSRMVDALSTTQLQDGYVSYRWERMMQETLPIPNSSCFLSMLFLPKSLDQSLSLYNGLEDTLARANTWLKASQCSGIPISFVNIQTEPLLTKISGETASSTVNAGSLSDLLNLTTASLYGFEDYHGVDIGVVRAVRLWYRPLGGEHAVEIILNDDDTKLGFAISRTEEGFIYISSVIEGDENAPSARSGLSQLHREATASSRLLIVSRVSNQKVLPWIVSSTGAIRCYDTVSLSQKLSLHRHAKVSILLHVFLWGRRVPPSAGTEHHISEQQPDSGSRTQPTPSRTTSEDDEKPKEGQQCTVERDTAGEISFRFHDFVLPNTWL